MSQQRGGQPPGAPSYSLTEAVVRLAEAPRDERAWHALYTHGRPVVLASVRRIVRYDDARAEDVCQDVFLTLLRTPPFASLTSPQSFASYLRTMAARHAVRDMRDPEDRARAPLEAAMGTAREADLAPLPDHLLAAESLYEEVLADLDSGDQQIVELLLAGSTLPEIVRATGLKYATAGSRVHRIRKRLEKFRR